MENYHIGAYLILQYGLISALIKNQEPLLRSSFSNGILGSILILLGSVASLFSIVVYLNIWGIIYGLLYWIISSVMIIFIINVTKIVKYTDGLALILGFIGFIIGIFIIFQDFIINNTTESTSIFKWSWVIFFISMPFVVVFSMFIRGINNDKNIIYFGADADYRAHPKLAILGSFVSGIIWASFITLIITSI